MEGDPPGPEVATAVSEALARGGHEHTAPEPTPKGAAWQMEHPCEDGALTCVVKLMNPAKRGWVLELSVRFTGRRKWRAKVSDAQEDALYGWGVSLRDELQADRRFHHISWSTPRDWW